MLARPGSALTAFSILTGQVNAQEIMNRAEREMIRLLGVDEADLEGRGLWLRKRVGRKLEIQTFTGLSRAGEGSILADYQLTGAWFLRSETRERGESTFELRREIRFW